MTAKPDKDNAPNLSVVTDFWGDDVMKHGWTAVPNALIILQADLDISPTDFCILLNILLHQWPTDGKSTSYPALNSIAMKIGVTKRTVQRGILNLEKKGLIITQQTNRNNRITKGRNIFNTAPLKEKLNTLSLEIKKKEKKIERNPSFIHRCVSCGKLARTADEITNEFGLRSMLAGNVIQSYCRECRKIQPKDKK